MDKVGFGIKLEQIIRLREKGQYEDAAKVADTIEWRKVKKWSELSVAGEVYEKAGRYKDARNICVYAYNRNLGGKRLLYKLTELSIIINDLEEAEELSDRIGIMKNGYLLAVGTVENLNQIAETNDFETAFVRIVKEAMV